MAKVTLVCRECGNTFAVPPSRSSTIYCSWVCRTARPRNYSQTVRVLWTCATCGKTEMHIPSDDRKYCSLACRPGRPKKRVRIACQNCGSAVDVPPSVLPRRRYCSRRCQMLARPINGKPSRVESASIAEWLSRHPGVTHETQKRVSRWSIDLALTDRMVAVEIDGAYWHSLPEMVEKDNRKDAYLKSRGWRVVRITVNRESPAEVADLIDEALAHLVTVGEPRNG